MGASEYAHNISALAENAMQLDPWVERADPLGREKVRLTVRVRLFLLRGRARQGHLRGVFPALLRAHLSEAVALRRRSVWQRPEGYG